MDRLARFLFPRMPRMVRYRKMRLLFVGIFLSLLAALVVGTLVYFANKIRP